MWAPPYSESSGGQICLHHLVHLLNQIGREAYLWPVQANRPYSTVKDRVKARFRSYHRSPRLNTPLASKAMVRSGDNVVIYPEMVLGNPLKAKRVVRWLLYKPGLRWSYEFGDDDMFFAAADFFDLPSVTGGAQQLSVWSVNPAYKNGGSTERAGLCYLIRKGGSKPRRAETSDPSAICIDGLSHEKINTVFNACETFISYDEASMFSLYAAVCGCTSIVVPGEFSDRGSWASSHELFRYGVAYGFSQREIEHARSTKDNVAKVLAAHEAGSVESVESFASLVEARFH